MEEPTIIEKLGGKDKNQEVVEKPVKVVATPKKRKNGLGFLLIILALVIVFPLMVLGYFFFTGQLHLGDYLNGGDDDVVDTEEEDTEEEVVLTDWESDNIKASLPEGWSLIEKDSFLDYTGYFGFEVFYKDDLVFEVSPTSAMGFECAHSELILFPDSKTVVGDVISAGSEELCGVVEIPVVRIDEYETVELLINSLRRSEENFYIENSYLEETDFYVTQDPSIPVFVELEDSQSNRLEYTGGGLTDGNIYITDYDLESLTEEERLILDQILESIEIVEEEVVLSESFIGEYIGVNSTVFDGDKDYYEFQSCDSVSSMCQSYMVEKNTDLDITLVEDESYILMDVIKGKGGAASGTSYTEVDSYSSIDIYLDWKQTEITWEGAYGERVYDMKLPVGFDQIDGSNGSVKIVYGDAYIEIFDVGECYPYTISENYRVLETIDNIDLIYLGAVGEETDGYLSMGSYTTLLEESSCQPNEIYSDLSYPCAQCGNPSLEGATSILLYVKSGLSDTIQRNYVEIFDEVMRESSTVSD